MILWVCVGIAITISLFAIVYRCRNTRFVINHLVSDNIPKDWIWYVRKYKDRLCLLSVALTVIVFVCGEKYKKLYGIDLRDKILFCTLVVLCSMTIGWNMYNGVGIFYDDWYKLDKEGKRGEVFFQIALPLSLWLIGVGIICNSDGVLNLD